MNPNLPIKLNIVLRTCDRVSVSNIEDRFLDKQDIIDRCLRSLYRSLENYKYYFGTGDLTQDIHLHIIDDASSKETQQIIKDLRHQYHDFHGIPTSLDFLDPRDQSDLTNKQKSRFSVGVQYEYIRKLPRDEMIYVAEDDYLYYEDSIFRMMEMWRWQSKYNPGVTVGVFPQDFTQMYFHPDHPHNSTYISPCYVLWGPDRYWRTTWFTHESFMVPVSLIHDNWDQFQTLMEIGFVEGRWEGNTLSPVWSKPNVQMLMPLDTLAFHLGSKQDISYHTRKKWEELWKLNNG